jgi:hypothetical protein
VRAHSNLSDSATAYAGSLLISLIAFLLGLNETQRLALVRGGGDSDDSTPTSRA